MELLLMTLEELWCAEASVASSDIASVRSSGSVDQLVTFQRSGCFEGLFTRLASKWSSQGVNLERLTQQFCSFSCIRKKKTTKNKFDSSNANAPLKGKEVQSKKISLKINNNFMIET